MQEMHQTSHYITTLLKQKMPVGFQQ